MKDFILVIFILTTLLSASLTYKQRYKIDMLEKQSIKHGCADYNSETGEFEWIRK